MGDAAVSALVSEVVGRLTSVVINELALLWGFKDDILTLKEDFKNIQAVLEDAEDKQIKEKTVELWLQSLRSASLEIENVLDDILAEALLQRLHKERGIKYREYLQSKLRGKKFVIVLDDVWIEEGERIKWNKLRETLSCGAEESVILMTTRYQTTSQMMAKVPELQHELGCLSEKDSGLLFKKHAFADGRVGGDISELEPIGRKIVEKCKGLPLAVKTLGSLMWSKSSISERLATCERQQYMGVERKQDLACFEVKL
ncbi:putative virus X resistance protein-like, coiled-coil [Helianthus annuus]|nr:putative virus X resistance protein-like, coiled-coil [Helianthus annuus]